MWTWESFKQHAKDLTSEQLRIASDIANTVLVRTGDEARAIRKALEAFSGENKDKLRVPGTGYGKRAEKTVRGYTGRLKEAGKATE